MRHRSRRYPYTNSDGVIHLSYTVAVDFDFDYIKRGIEQEDWQDDFESKDQQIRRFWLGSWMSLSPSGKIYAPFACSNVYGCAVCKNEGTLPATVRRRVRKKYRNKARKLRSSLLRRYGPAFEHRWPPHLAERLHRFDDLGRERVTCPRCGGCESAEAHDDEIWRERVEEELEKRGLFLDEYAGDLFAAEMRTKEEEDEEEETAVRRREPRRRGREMCESLLRRQDLGRRGHFGLFRTWAVVGPRPRRRGGGR